MQKYNGILLKVNKNQITDTRKVNESQKQSVDTG